MSRTATKSSAAEAARLTAKRTPPAWLICAAMFVFAVVTIVLVIGQ
ncbi:MAG: hypothetical protein ACRDLN_11700 [Solirubrobacteraceae bacterium]